MSELSDAVLQNAKHGDRQAVSMLIRAWHRPLRAFVTTLLLGSQDTDDIAQEAFLRALERLDRVTDIDALGPFLRGIARNVVRERQRKYVREAQAYERLVETRCQTDAAIKNASWLTDPDLLTTLRSCVTGLPDRSREMLALRYNDELASEQIGQRLGLNGPTVRTAMRRARDALLKCIRGRYGPAMEATQ